MKLRQRPEDFVVREECLLRPAVGPADAGEYTMYSLHKRGITTPEAVRRAAGLLGVEPRRARCCGFKDRHAVATQVVTIRTPEGVLRDGSPGEVLEDAAQKLGVEDLRRLGQAAQGRASYAQLPADLLEARQPLEAAEAGDRRAEEVEQQKHRVLVVVEQAVPMIAVVVQAGDESSDAPQAAEALEDLDIRPRLRYRCACRARHVLTVYASKAKRTAKSEKKFTANGVPNSCGYVPQSPKSAVSNRLVQILPKMDGDGNLVPGYAEIYVTC